MSGGGATDGRKRWRRGGSAWSMALANLASTRSLHATAFTRCRPAREGRDKETTGHARRRRATEGRADGVARRARARDDDVTVARVAPTLRPPPKVTRRS